MSSDAYREILGQVELLSLEEQLDLIADILKIVRRHTVKPRHHIDTLVLGRDKYS